MYRVALILAVLAAIGSLAISFTVTKPKIEGLTADLESTQTQLASEQQARTEADRKEKSATAAAEKAARELADAQKELETQSAEAQTQRTRADKYFADLNKATAERNTAQEQLAQWTALGIQPGQVTALKADLKESREANVALAGEKKILERGLAATKAKLAKYEDEQQVIAMPGLKGSVVAVDPKWEFVVLDVGSNQGALEGGQLMVRRGDKLVGKVRLVTVEANRSVANLLPAWKQGDVAVVAGDLVLY